MPIAEASKKEWIETESSAAEFVFFSMAIEAIDGVIAKFGGYFVSTRCWKGILFICQYI